MDLKEQNELALSLERAGAPLKNLTQAMDRACEFYFERFPEKMRRLKELKSLLILRDGGKPSSVPDFYGLDLRPMEFDRAHVMMCKRKYYAIAKFTHPDKGGSDHLFHVSKLAYDARDIYLLNLILSALHNQKSVKEVSELLAKRCAVLVNETRMKPAFALVQADPYAGRRGENSKALALAETILTQTIERFEVALLDSSKA